MKDDTGQSAWEDVSPNSSGHKIHTILPTRFFRRSPCRCRLRGTPDTKARSASRNSWKADSLPTTRGSSRFCGVCVTIARLPIDQRIRSWPLVARPNARTRSKSYSSGNSPRNTVLVRTVRADQVGRAGAPEHQVLYQTDRRWRVGRWL